MHKSRGRLNGNLLLEFPAHYDNKYVIFYSLWPCCFIPSLNLVADRHMFSCFVILILIMAGFYDDNDFSLSGLMPEGHDFVTVIESSSSDDENYHGLLDCACQLPGESDKSSIEGGVQGGVVHAVMDQVSWKLRQICQFLKCLIVDYFLQTIWHLLPLTQTS